LPIIIKTIEEIIPHLKRVSKSWRSLTPQVKDSLLSLLSRNPIYSGMNLFHLDLRKDVLHMRSGTFSSDQYKNIFGWSEEEISSLIKSKDNIIKNSSGGLTPCMKEFWIKHHGLSEKDAIKKVSEIQTKLSKRKKKTVFNNPISLQYYLQRGINKDEAIRAQSEVQKKRRNNCIEYWLNKGYSKEYAKKEISNLQKLRSKLSIEYWLHRGYTLEQAQKEAYLAQKAQMPSKVSKISKKFFTELLLELKKYGYLENEFKYGDNEECIYISSKRRIYLDFYHQLTKKVIEFDGKYWHSEKTIEDEKRDKMLKELGYSVLRIPETYDNELWNKYLIQAVEFIVKEN
jgi:hypothetical protein